MREEYFLTGPMEKTSEPYSIAKAAGVVMCQAYRRQYGFNTISVVPATVYGPGNFEGIEDAHVMGALMGKFAKAIKDNVKAITCWGSGMARREFLYSEDLADAVFFLLNNYDSSDLLNLGSGEDISIRELAEEIKTLSGFGGHLEWDVSKSDGAAQKLLDSSRMRELGWRPKTSLEEGLKKSWASIYGK
jgi:GDP-L-fucose synthase